VWTRLQWERTAVESLNFPTDRITACLVITWCLSPGDFVLDGDPVPFPQNGAEPPPQFSAHFYCGQTAACIKIRHGMELGLGPGDFVLDGDPVALSPKRGRTPKFSAHIYCDQTAGWRKLVLGMVVGLSPGECVLDGDPAPPPKGAEQPPQF